MTEQEYNMEVLCTCYSLEKLNARRCELCAGAAAHNGPDVIDDVTIDVLNKAIQCYNTEKYKQIREEMLRNRIKLS